jgi:hypothetical protein
MPWQADPLRENPHDREHLFEMYLGDLQKNERNFTVLTGSLENRQEVIKVEVLSLLNA